jgi:hypothetical protein
MKGAKPTVYLAGPITGQSYTGAVDWREQAKASFAEAGIVAFSPMRQKEYLSREQAIDGTPKAYADQILSRPKGIVTRDRDDTRTVDLVLMNLLPAEEELRRIDREVQEIIMHCNSDNYSNPMHCVGDVMHAFNRGRGVTSIGTMIEAGWADAFRTPLVVVMSESNPHNHAMLAELAGYIVPTLEQGIEIAKTVLLP